MCMLDKVCGHARCARVRTREDMCMHILLPACMHAHKVDHVLECNNPDELDEGKGANMAVGRHTGIFQPCVGVHASACADALTQMNECSHQCNQAYNVNRRAWAYTQTCAALHWAALHCAALRCTALRCIALYFIALRRVASHRTAPRRIALHHIA